MRSATILATAAAAALSLATAAHATIIYQTDFEAPGYSTGPLGGQNGWATFGNAAASSVTGVGAIDGLQSAVVDSSLTAGQTGPFRADPSGIQKVTLSADIMLTSSSANRSWQFSAIGPALVGFTGGIDIDANGTIHAITSGFGVIGSFSRDTTHRVDLLLDYGTSTYGVKLDGSTLASGLAFCGDNGPCSGSGPTAYSDIIFDTFGAQGGDKGYLDNILVQSTPGVPEPSTWALSILGFAAMGGMLRRRRAVAA